MTDTTPPLGGPQRKLTSADGTAERDQDVLVEQLRAQTPMIAGGVRHLNNAGSSPMPEPVLDRVLGYLARESEIGGYEAADESVAAIRQSYEDVGKLVGVPPESVAIVENATVAVAQALSSFDFQADDVILTSRNDYVSNQLMYLSLARRLGVVVERAEDLPEGGIDPESVASCIARKRPVLVAVTHMPTNSGLVQDVESVGKVCLDLEVPYLVDACQTIGQLPVQMERLNCDFLAATARKFLRGPRGIGFLAVSKRALERELAPLYIDLHGAEWTGPDTYQLTNDARRYENWEFNYANVVGLGEAATYARACGLEWIERRVGELAAYARTSLGNLEHVRILDHGSRLGAIVSFTVDTRGAQELEWVGRLRTRSIHTSAIAPSSAVIDFESKRAAFGVRVSPHAFNLESEIDELVEAVAELVRETVD